MAVTNWYWTQPAEVTYDILLIVIQLIISCFHLIRLRIRYLKSLKAQRWFRSLDSRHFSFGIIFFAFGLVVNRFNAVSHVYPVTITSCSHYLYVALIFASAHKGCNYIFILFRMKFQLLDSKLRKYSFYSVAVFITIYEISFLVVIRAWMYGYIAEIRHNAGFSQCDFSQHFLNQFAPIYVGVDLILSLMCLLSFIYCLKPKNIAIQNNQQLANKIILTINRIKLWASIAMSFTFVSGILVILINGASPIFLVADVVVNSFCAVMQFTPVNDNLSLSYTQQLKVFLNEIRRYICPCGYIQPEQQLIQNDNSQINFNAGIQNESITDDMTSIQPIDRE